MVVKTHYRAYHQTFIIDEQLDFQIKKLKSGFRVIQMVQLSTRIGLVENLLFRVRNVIYKEEIKYWNRRGLFPS